MTERICTICNQRPRWSEHLSCLRCVECTGGARVIMYMEKRKKTEGGMVPGLRAKRRRERCRKVYAELRMAGLPAAEAKLICSCGKKAKARLLELQAGKCA